MILNSQNLRNLIDQHQLVVPFNEYNLIETGIKLHLSPTLKILKSDVDTMNLESVEYEEVQMNSDGYVVKPNEFLVGFIKETINMPDGYWGMIDSRGALTKIGLSFVLDYHIDPSYSGQLTIQIINYSKHSIKIYPDLYALRVTVFEVKN